jgi:hypothetical protein
MIKFLTTALVGLGFVGRFRRREDHYARGTEHVMLGLPDHG